MPNLPVDLLLQQARASLAQGDCRGGLTAGRQALGQAQQAGDAAAEGRANAVLAELHVRLRELEPAMRHAHRALPLLRAAGDRRGECETLACQAFIYEALGMREGAPCSAAALELADTLGDRVLQCRVLQRAGMAQARLHDLEGARRRFAKAIALARELHDDDLLGGALCNFGQLLCELADWAGEAGESDKCRDLLQSAVDQLDEGVAAYLRRSASALAGLGLVNAAAAKARAGRLDEADADLARAERISGQPGAEWLQPMVLEVRAGVLLGRGQDDVYIDRMLHLHGQYPASLQEAGPSATRRLYLALKRRWRFEEALYWCERTAEFERARSDLQARLLLDQMEVEQALRDAQAARDALRGATEQAAQLRQEHERLQVRTDELARAAEFDALTGLRNRRFLEAYLQSVAPAQTRCLAMGDIDHFKRINDTFGHGIGDAVLRQMGALLSSQLREGDTAVRYGGEEFVLLFPASDPRQALLACERIRQCVQAHEWGRVAPNLSVTISIGLAFAAQAEAAAALLSRADAALYAAKAQGRNRVETSHAP